MKLDIDEKITKKWCMDRIEILMCEIPREKRFKEPLRQHMRRIWPKMGEDVLNEALEEFFGPRL